MKRHLAKWLVLVCLGMTPLPVLAALQMHLTLDNTTADASGNGNNATLLNGATYGAGVINQGGSFDGTNDYARVNGFNPGSTFSVAMWVRPSNLGGMRTFIEYVKNNRVNDFFLGYDGGLGQIFVELEDSNRNEGGGCGSSGGAKICTGIALATNRWYHVTAVVTPTQLDVYINGVLASSQAHTRTVNFNSGVWLVGGDSDSNPYNNADSDYYAGLMDDVRVYSHALTPAEISQVLGLQGSWRFDECSWTGTAGEVVDSSGNGRHGSRGGSATTASAKVCFGALLNGTSDYVEIPHDPALNGTTGLTYAAWINPTNWSGTRQVMAKSVHGGGSGRAQMGIFSESGVLKGRAETAAGQYEISTTLPPLSSWSHVALVFGGTSLTLYVDGVQRATTAFGATTLVGNGDPLDISKRVGSNQYFFEGMIDEVRVYSRGLLGEEIASIAADTTRSCPVCTPGGGTLAYYALDEAAWNGTPSEVKDSSGNSHDGVRVGTAQTVLPTPATPPGTCRAGDIPSNTSTNQYYAVNTGLDVNTAVGNNGSITFWYKGDTNWNNGTSRTLFDASNNLGNGGADKYFFLVKEGNGRLRFRLEDSNDTDTQARTGTNNFTAGTWVHIGVTWDLPGDRVRVYINGALRATGTTNVNGTLGNTNTLYIGDNRTTGVSSNGYSGNSAHGVIDEVRIYNSTRSLAEIQADMAAGHTCGNVDHFSIGHDGNGINCQAEPITISAHDSTHGVYSAYTGTINLSTSTAHGDWSLVSGSGILNNLGNGQASYTYSVADSGQVQLGLRDTFVETVNINVTDGSVGESPLEDANLAFARAGFNFLAGGVKNAIGTQIGGKPSNVAPGSQVLQLQAVKTSDDTGACEAALVGSTTVQLAFECTDPVTCTTSRVAINGSNIAANNLGAPLNYTNVALDFGDATTSTAPIVFSYPDVGRIQLHARTVLSPSGEQMLGSSNAFVVRPFAFEVTAAGNPGATTPAGAGYTAAGANFSITSRAVLWQGADDANTDGVADGHANTDTDPTNNANLADNTAALNFGREVAASQVSLGALLNQPSGGSDPGLAGGTTVSGFTNGAGSTATAHYDEVGIVELYTGVTGNNYLAIGAAETGKIVGRSGYVGRFYPDHFNLVSGTITPACGNFTYMSQPALGLAYDIQAQNLAGGVTSNYDTAAGTVTGTVAIVAENGNDGTDLSARAQGLPATNWAAGVYSVNTTGARFARAAAVDGAFENLQLGVAVTDPDSRVLQGLDMNPATNTDCTLDSSCSGKALPGTTAVRFGRLMLQNAYGSELLALTVPVQAQYYVDANEGFKRNGNDSCTALTTAYVDLSNNLADPPVGNPTISVGAGTTTAAFSAPAMSGGTVGLVFSAPGAGNAGYVDIDAILTVLPAYPWLQYDWDSDGNHDNNPPRARANFGVYPGNQRQIYWRELY